MKLLPNLTLSIKLDLCQYTHLVLFHIIEKKLQKQSIFTIEGKIAKVEHCESRNFFCKWKHLVQPTSGINVNIYLRYTADPLIFYVFRLVVDIVKVDASAP